MLFFSNIKVILYSLVFLYLNVSNNSAEEWSQFTSGLSQFSGSNMSPAQLANATPEQMGNSQDMEVQWAEKAFKHAEVYFRLISTFPDHSRIPLTRIDENIYSHFRKVFPRASLDVSVLTEDLLKSEAAKSLWRPFCLSYDENTVADFNFGTLLRLQANRDYEEDNTCIVPRIQFLAIEIARLREGCNLSVVVRGMTNSK